LISQEVKVISSETTITKMFLVDDTIMFQKINDGIYKIENGMSKLVTSNKIIKDEDVVNVFSQNENYLIQTVSKGFFVLDNNELRKWDMMVVLIIKLVRLMA